MYTPVFVYIVEIQFYSFTNHYIPGNYTKHLVYLDTLSEVFMLSSTWPSCMHPRAISMHSISRTPVMRNVKCPVL